VLDRTSELRRFLRTRRARISPADVGLPTDKRRRAAGLRREDVAELAEISVSWYGQFEAGRAPHASAQTIESIARVLRLDEIETAYLFKLTGATGSGAGSMSPTDGAVPATIHNILRTFSGPAYLINRYYDVIAANLQARILWDLVPGRDNYVRKLFVNEWRRAGYVDWDHLAEKFVAHMRMRTASRIGDPRFDALIEEVRAHSVRFATLWDSGEVGTSFGRTVRVLLPGFGVALFTLATLPIPTTEEHILILAAPSSDEYAARVETFLATHRIK
jgi:transcriptional regulator with XRE-family HTH domain